MTNIRGLDDLKSSHDEENPKNNFIRQLQEDHVQSMRDQQSLDSGPVYWDHLSTKTKEPPLDPLNEGFFFMLRVNICPLLTWLSFTVFMAFFLTIIFFVQFRIDGLAKKPVELMEINEKGKFTDWGATELKALQIKSQYYRLFTALFLHTSMAHLLGNLFILILWGSYIEGIFGAWRTMLVFIFSGIYGNLMSALGSFGRYSSIGTSTSIFGYFGAGFGYLIVNWSNMNHSRSPRGMFLCVLSIITIINLIGSPSDVAIFSHIGGLIGGFLSGFFVSPIYKNPHQKENGMVPKRTGLQIFYIIFGVVLYVLGIGIMVLLV